MLATQTPESGPEARDVKQWIKGKIARTLKALQKRYITTDTAVTSEDLEANLLCCALEAVFIHGIKSKFIRSDGSHARKGGSRGALPQPVFWSLLKTVTHRAWVRLALNDGLLECYLTSLFRDGSNLGSYYQPGAILLDPEDREVLLTLLQGLSSMTFQLSYKSAVLNEWTNTPLVLAGLCPPTPADEPLVGPKRKESWDTVSESSGGSGSSDWAQDVLQREPRREQNEGCEVNTPLTSSNLSLDTSGSSQLSSSLSSDSLLQGQEENSSSNQDLKEHFDVFIPASDSAAQAVNDKTHMPDTSPTAAQDAHQSDSCSEKISAETIQETVEGTTEESETVVKTTAVTETPESEQKEENKDSPVDSPPVSASTERVEKTSDLKDPDALLPKTSTATSTVEKSQHAVCRRSAKEMGSSEAYAIIDDAQMNGQVSPTSEPDTVQPPPSVVHRRHNGLPNPFRGLVKLGQLERRNAVGIWWDYYCELSPFELRLYMNAEERICYENLSLLRCEDVRLSSGTEGRFRLSFLGKKIYLRAPSRGEAEDWVDRIVEAISKLRPIMRDEQWEVLHTSNDQDVPSPTPSSPEHTISELPDPPQLDWTRHKDPEPDAIKEAVVYQNLEEKGWRSVLLSLSLETLRGYRVQGDFKTPLFSHPIGNIRDVVPDVSLGSPAFFKVLTAQDTLTLRAESGEEARGWRSLIRGALDSYLETEDDGAVQGVSSSRLGSVHKLVQHRLKGDGMLLSHLCIVPNERGLDAQNYKCAGCPSQIGISLGKARLCEFSGQYYCESCHQGDTTIIPSRMVHNWDLTAREVSKQAFKLLTQIEHEPLLHLDILNPDLFDHTDIMEKIADGHYESYLQCNICKTVYHSACKAKCPVCPRCVRIQKYMERDLDG
ncbi:Pleckstrin homology domain-containing family M member 1 [Labeo rohita]|uniref:Pleckstrin homology domain-containing family M member 1 n=1 Tax=Labeo rohita TaxID=84645 RepID=A0ABQ8M817_LABRO|nr:Pleckstrin homology domain-containing family M member 1 [Labeo rohita]